MFVDELVQQSSAEFGFVEVRESYNGTPDSSRLLFYGRPSAAVLRRWRRCAWFEQPVLEWEYCVDCMEHAVLRVVLAPWTEVR